MKNKIISQLIKRDKDYIAVWVIDGVKHQRIITASDSKSANEKYRQIITNIKKNLERKTDNDK